MELEGAEEEADAAEETTAELESTEEKADTIEEITVELEGAEEEVNTAESEVAMELEDTDEEVDLAEQDAAENSFLDVVEDFILEDSPEAEQRQQQKKEKNSADAWYDADAESIVQETLNLELDSGEKAVFDTDQVKNASAKKRTAPVKERISNVSPAKGQTPNASSGKEGTSGVIPSKESLISKATTILFYLNDEPLRLPLKKDGDFYYLMDMIEHSGIDLKQPKGRVTLTVNGEPGIFMQKLSEGDIIRIVEE